MIAYIKKFRATNAPFGVSIWHQTSGENSEQDAARVQAFADAGVTWWQEDCSLWRWSPVDSRQRIRQGPPKM